MRILITTGIYPPEIGGPAEYAKNLKETWTGESHKVSVKVFSHFNFLPTGVRHLVYFLYILPAVIKSDFVLTLDTFSAALPSVLAARILGKKIILRTGGDFLWESYVERTGELVLLRNFYTTCLNNLSAKEQKIFRLIKFVLKNVSAIVWSTEWQKNIFLEPYELSSHKHFVIENYYGPKESNTGTDFKAKTFVASTRNLKWKNINTLKHVFNKKGSKIPEDIDLFTYKSEFNNFMQVIKKSYAVILVSLGDISPNMILDAIRFNKPFICTKEVGIFGRIKDIGIFVDPLNEQEIENAVIQILDKGEHEKWSQKVRDFNFTHTWEEMAKEYEELYKSIK